VEEGLAGGRRLPASLEDEGQGLWRCSYADSGAAGPLPSRLKEPLPSSPAPSRAVAEAPPPLGPTHGPVPGPTLALVVAPLRRIDEGEKRVSAAAFHGR
jgi:hypothetical protein